MKMIIEITIDLVNFILSFTYSANPLFQFFLAVMIVIPRSCFQFGLTRYWQLTKDLEVTDNISRIANDALMAIRIIKGGYELEDEDTKLSSEGGGSGGYRSVSKPSFLMLRIV